MGVDINVYKGYGIMILTKDLTEEQKELIFNDIDDEEQGSAGEYVFFDLYDHEDSKWLFIPITAKNQEKMENGIWQFNQIIDFGTKGKNIPSFILPLFDLGDKTTKGCQEKALSDLNERHEKRKEKTSEQERKGIGRLFKSSAPACGQIKYLDRSYEKVLKVLENKMLGMLVNF